MLVSIITPTYNSMRYIDETYQSIRAQTYVNWEWIITDDNSTDGTYDFLSNLSKTDTRIKVYRNHINQGAGFSRNVCIKNSCGRFIAFLDSDDLWLPRKLEIQTSFMVNNKYALTYGYYQKFNSSGDCGVIKAPDTTNYNKLLHSNVIGCLTAMYDTELIGKKYMPTIRKRQDMALWLEILKEVDQAHCVKETIARYRSDSGMTSNKLNIIFNQWQFYREHLKLNVILSCFYFLSYAYNGFAKKLK